MGSKNIPIQKGKSQKCFWLVLVIEEKGSSIDVNQKLMAI